MVYNQGFDRILLKNVEIITCDFCDFTYLIHTLRKNLRIILNFL